MLDKNESEEGLIVTSEVFLGSNMFASHLYLYEKKKKKTTYKYNFLWFQGIILL